MTPLSPSSASLHQLRPEVGGGAQSAPRGQTVPTALEAMGEASRREAASPLLEGRVTTAAPAEPATPLSSEKLELLQTFKIDRSAFMRASPELRNDRDIVLAAVTQYGDALEWASRELQNDRVIVFAAVTEYTNALRFASPELRNDRDIVLAAVTQNGLAVSFAGDALRKDRDIFLAAVTQDGLALMYDEGAFREDREIVLAAVAQNGAVLFYACDALRNDRDIVLAAVTQNGSALMRVGNALKNDRDIVLAAVTQNGGALKDASQALRNERDIVLAAVTQNGYPLMYASPELRNDPTFLLAAAEKNGLVLQWIPEPLRTLEVCSAAVAQNVEAIRHVPTALIEESRSQMDNPAYFPLLPSEEQSPERARNAVEYNPLFLGCINANIVDEEILIAALRRKPEALNLIDPDLLTASHVATLVYDHNALLPNNAAADPNEGRKSALKKLADLAMKGKIGNNDIIYLLAQYFNDDREFMIFAIAKYGVEFPIASERLRGDPSVVSEIMDINPKARDCIPEILASGLSKINTALFE